MQFATSEDLAARWKPLTDAEAAKAEVLLKDAAVFLSALVEVDSTDEGQLAKLRIVSCSMVQRAMVAAQNDTFGVSEERVTADIYSQSLTFANPSGDMYLTAAEKRLLGITGSYLIGLRPTINPVEVRWNEHCW